MFNRRSFMLALPAAALSTEVILASDQVRVLSLPVLRKPVDRRAELHAMLMEYFGNRPSPILDFVTIHVPSGAWRVRFTGWTEHYALLETMSRWVAGFVGEDPENPYYQVAGMAVHVSSPGYGGVVRMGEMIPTEYRTGITHLGAINEPGYPEHIRSFMLNVLLDMIWESRWDVREPHSMGKENLNRAWPKLMPSTQFYLDQNRWLHEVHGMPLDKGWAVDSPPDWNKSSRLLYEGGKLYGYIPA